DDSPSQRLARAAARRTFCSLRGHDCGPSLVQLEQVVPRCDECPLTADFSSPRNRNCRKPRAALIWPKGGATITLRRALSRRATPGRAEKPRGTFTATVS